MTYGDPTTLTITLTSLASSATAGRESNSVSNATDKFTDVLVRVKTKVGAGTIGADYALYVYAYGSLDEASPVYPDVVTGSDAAITPNNPSQLRLIGVVALLAQNTAYVGGPFSVASGFNGIMPKRWGLVIRNYCNIALSGTASDHEVVYQGVS